MVTPYVLRYDLCILSISVAFLVKDGLSRGFLAGERTVIVICIAAFLLWLAPMMPVGEVISPVILFLIGRRIVVYDRSRRGADERKDDARHQANAIAHAV
jgi:hypothetical protein